MGFSAWIKALLRLNKKDDNDKTIQELKREIEKLKRENKDLREKIIIFPQKNKEQIPIRFFDENIEAEIIRNISEANEEICIAVAWFTSWKLMEELNKLKRRGINIKVIISDAKENIKQKNINKLRNACNIVKIAVVPEENGIMHNKYCIIDNKKVIDGSYNWSYNAHNNLEHVIVIESSAVAKMYKESFNKIYNNPRYYFESNVYDGLG
jgi:phosphatidylserine/phosphatidylglycerophosphate/cardiolipin synthase-like enzyme